MTTPARTDTYRPGPAHEREAEPAPIRVGTRGSALALWQTHYVLDHLRVRAPGVAIAIEEITTSGDRTQALAVPLTQLGDKSMFVAELERALLAGAIDLAVHSLKDLPGRLDPGLALAATPERADPCDALVSRSGRRLADLPKGAVVATSSLRRRAQLLHLRPDLRIVEMRGNVDTRLRKALAPDGPDATLLAVAGLERLGLGDRVTERLPADVLVPAVGQGALAVEIRADDARMRRLLRQIDHKRTRLAVTAERAALAALGGGCQVPLGAYASVSADGETIRLIAVVASLDGAQLVRVEREGSARRPAALGREVARELLRQGGSEILRAILK
ncbi:MAG TPA: hydroxymethylbilane synthase [Ktedonobacterales bacterium]|nr:hydroxymethylbilane synthase [Ktedonobacterales bacterium]